MPPSPTDDEDLATKPAAQIAYRSAYPSSYGPPAAVERLYRTKAQEYRDLYYRLHAEVDGPLDRVRRAMADGGSDEAVLVRTSDHGELLGAHGGLHQKWFNLYDEAARVPFVIARTGANATEGRIVDDAPTSHVDLVPTLLAAAGIDWASTAEHLRTSFSEVHPLPGRNLMDVVDGAAADRQRQVYAITRDNMPEGDSGASGVARRLRRNKAGAATTPRLAPLRIQVPAHVAANFESLVGRVDDSAAEGGGGHLWKIVRSFDDPDTWTEPGIRHLAANGLAGEMYRSEPLPDQWELYDLDTDPIEVANRWNDPDAGAVFALLVARLATERDRAQRALALCIAHPSKAWTLIWPAAWRSSSPVPARRYPMPTGPGLPRSSRRATPTSSSTPAGGWS